MGHVRNLTEEWDNVLMEYEKENEHLRDELMQLQQGNPFPLKHSPRGCIAR